jgi:hypothetical protein
MTFYAKPDGWRRYRYNYKLDAVGPDLVELGNEGAVVGYVKEGAVVVAG